MLDEGDGAQGNNGAGSGGGAGRLQQWDEVMDPNSNPTKRPASDATVATLPRKTFDEVVKKEGQCCSICGEGSAFEAESMVVGLPCGHVFDVQCLVTWIQ